MARRAFHAKKRFSRMLSNDCVEDVASELTAAFFALHETERPASELAFETWAFRFACRSIGSEIRRHAREVPDIIQTGTEEMAEISRIDLLMQQRVDHLSTANKPMQLIRCEVMDALKMISFLTEEQQTLIWRVAESGDVIGYAEDHSVSLLEAMSAIKRAREVMNRIAEDLADERKEAASAA